MSDDDKKPTLRKRIGEFLILGIYLYADVKEFWNADTHHILCLSLAVIGITALLLNDGVLSNIQVGVSSLIAAFFAAIIALAAPPYVAPDMVDVGLLQAANDPTPPTGCNPTKETGNPYWSPFGGLIRFQVEKPKVPVPKDATIVAVGGNGIIVTKNGKVPIIVIAECNLLSIEKTPSGLLIDANIYDFSGKLVAAIKDNAFRAFEGPESHATQEGDFSTFIVKEGAAERLWVHYANKNAVKIRGIFACPRASTNVIVATDDVVRMIPDPKIQTPAEIVSANTCRTDQPIGYEPPATSAGEKSQPPSTH